MIKRQMILTRYIIQVIRILSPFDHIGKVTYNLTLLITDNLFSVCDQTVRQTSSHKIDEIGEFLCFFFRSSNIARLNFSEDILGKRIRINHMAAIYQLKFPCHRPVKENKCSEKTRATFTDRPVILSNWNTKTFFVRQMSNLFKMIYIFVLSTILVMWK